MLEKLDTLIAFAVVMLAVSLIITIFTQITSTALGLRGSNLLWGIETLLKELAPDLSTKDNPDIPRKVAEGILTHPLISDSLFARIEDVWLIGPIVNRLIRVPPIGWVIKRWRCATAIGPDELARMLDRVAAAKPEVGAALKDLLAAPDPEAKRRATLLNAALAPFVPPAALATGYAVQVDKILQQAAESARQSVGKLEAWFNSSMDRVSQRFAIQVRIWTIVFAFSLAFGVHLDSLRLFEQISTNSAVRSALVGIRGDVLGEAKAIIPPAAAPSAAPATAAVPATDAPVSAEVLQGALTALKKSAPQSNVIPDKIDVGIATVKEVETWLQAKGVPPETVGRYRGFVIGALVARADDIDKQLQKAGVDLIPSPYPGDPNQWWPSRVVRELFQFNSKRNFLGILLTAAFLSLGAPFWYNALKNLSNLRSTVANKQDQAA
jgi:hypothetical protein